MSENYPGSQNILQQGHAEAWNGSWMKAADLYRQVFESDRNNSRSAHFLALSLLEMGELEKSLEYYIITANLIPDDPVPVEKIGLIHEKLGRISPSIQYLDKASDLFIKNGNVTRAVYCLQHILKQNPSDENARTRLEAITIQNNLDLSDLSTLVDEQPIQSTTEVIPKQKKQEPVEESHEKALSNLAKSFFEIASSSRFTQSTIEAEISTHPITRRNLSDDPETLDLLNHLNKAAEFLSRGMDEWCLTELQALMQSGINNPAIYFLTGSLLSENKPNQALSYLKQTRSNSDYAMASFLLIGKICYKMENFQEAAAAYLQALAVADSTLSSTHQTNRQPGIFKPLIKSYSHETNASFLKNLCETIELEINSPDWREHLTTLHMKISGQQQNGSTMLAELLAAGGSTLVQRYAGVKELENDDHSRSAMEEIFNMIDDGPVLLPAQLLIAENLSKQGLTGEAVEKLQLAAKLYSLRGQSGQAVQALEQAVELDPLDISARSKLIDLLKRQSKFEQVVTHTLKLAEIHYQLAEQDNAHQVLSDAIRTTLNSPDSRQYSLLLLHKNADLFMQDLQLRHACQIYEHIISLDPEDILANARMIAINYKLGQRDTARQKINSFIHYLVENNKTDQVEKFLKVLTEELPEVMEIRKYLADWFHKRGDKDQTIEQLDIIAEQLMRKNKFEGAAIVLKTIIALKPDNISKYQELIQQIVDN